MILSGGSEQHFRETEAFGVDSDVVTDWKLVVLRLEQHFREYEALAVTWKAEFRTNFSVWRVWRSH